MKQFYRNHLPHITPLGGCFFVTFCTYDSIPIHKNIGKSHSNFLKEFKKIDVKHDDFNSGIDISILPFSGFIKEKILEMDNDYYELLYYCIMQNHVHMIINTGFIEDPIYLSKNMKILKGSTARNINLALNRTGTFWQKDSYDHLIRNDIELGLIGDYILENPVKAGLISKWEDWPNTYVKYT